MSDRHWYQKGWDIGTPGKDHIYQYKEVCVGPPCVPWVKLVHCRVVAEGLPEVESWGDPDVGQLVLPQVLVKG